MMSYPIFNIFDCAIEIAMTNSKCLMATLQFQENILFNFVTNKMRWDELPLTFDLLMVGASYRKSPDIGKMSEIGATSRTVIRAVVGIPGEIFNFGPEPEDHL